MNSLWAYGETSSGIPVLSELVLRQGIPPAAPDERPLNALPYASGGFQGSRLIAASPDGEHLLLVRTQMVGANLEQVAGLHSTVNGGQPIRVILNVSSSNIRAIALSDTCAAAGEEYRFVAQHIEPNGGYTELTINGWPYGGSSAPYGIRRLVFSPDGSQLVVFSEYYGLLLFQVGEQSLNFVRSLWGNFNFDFDDISVLQFSADGSALFVYALDEVNAYLVPIDGTAGSTLPTGISGRIFCGVRIGNCLLLGHIAQDYWNGETYLISRFDFASGDFYPFISTAMFIGSPLGQVTAAYHLAYEPALQRLWIAHSRFTAPNLSASPDYHWSYCRLEDLMPYGVAPNFQLPHYVINPVYGTVVSHYSSMGLVISQRAMGRIYGTVRDVNNQPAARTVELYSSSPYDPAFSAAQQRCLGRTVSDAATGEYLLHTPEAFLNYPYDGYSVVFKAEQGENLNDLIYARVTPEWIQDAPVPFTDWWPQGFMPPTWQDTAPDDEEDGGSEEDSPPPASPANPPLGGARPKSSLGRYYGTVAEGWGWQWRATQKGWRWVWTDDSIQDFGWPNGTRKIHWFEDNDYADWEAA